MSDAAIVSMLLAALAIFAIDLVLLLHVRRAARHRRPPKVLYGGGNEP